MNRKLAGHFDENISAGFCDAEKGMFNIGLLHTSLDGREGHANYAPCSLDDLVSKGYQYWALGHIHKQEKLEQQIKAIGAEIAGDQLWIERVENRTQGKYDLETTLADDTALGKLLKSIISTPDDMDQMDGLADIISELRLKLPPQAFGTDTILDLNDGQTIKRITKEAQKMLIGRILSAGGENEN